MKEKMTVILFSGELDKAIAAFTLATTAAASGMEVSIFFTFWGLNVLKKNTFALSKSQNFIQKIFNILSPKTLPLSKLNMFGLGPWIMQKMIRKTKMASLEDLMRLAKELGVKYIACTTSCSFFGLDKDALIRDVNEFAGASTYLAEALNAKINLFI